MGGWETSHGSSECKEEKYNTSEMNIFDEMSKLLINFHHKTNFKFCEKFRNIEIEHDNDKSINSCTDEEDSYRIRVVYDKFPYIELVLVGAHTEFELLMNIGFAIGLFCGVSILQIPNILTKTYKKVRGKICVTNQPKEPVNILDTQIPYEATDLLGKHINDIYNKLNSANKKTQNLKKCCRSMRL